MPVGNHLPNPLARRSTVHPCKCARNGIAVRVRISITVALSPPLDRLSGAPMRINIWGDATIPAHFTRSTAIKTALRVEQRALVGSSTALPVGKQHVNGFSHRNSSVMMASAHASRRNNIPVLVGQRQKMAGLGFLSPRIRDTFAPFLATVWLLSRSNLYPVG
jgi:hypothetical protein